MPLSMNLYLKEVQISTFVSSVAKNDSKILFGPTSGISKKETHRGGIHGLENHCAAIRCKHVLIIRLLFNMAVGSELKNSAS